MQQHKTHLLTAKQCPQQHSIAERGRHREQPDFDIARHQRLNLVAGRQHHLSCQMHSRHGHNHQAAKHHCNHKATYQMMFYGLQILSPVRLRNKPCCGHPQEAKTKIDEIEDKTAKCCTTNKAWIIQPPHHRSINCANQWKGDIGKKYRPCDGPDTLPACLRLPVFR